MLPALTGFSMASKAPSQALETILGHTFKDHALLQRALTHASFGGGQTDVTKTYQRLEFLGDRVLALVIADALMERFAKADEGELARRLNHLVRAETCADIAEKLGIARFVRTDDLDVTKPSRAARSVLADVCEALIAALYLDGGSDAAKRFILAHWQGVMDQAGAARRDPKTALQEWAHANHYPTPVYQEMGRNGPDHAPIFEITVRIEGLDSEMRSGKSKRDAQQAAAKAMLIRQSVWDESEL